MTEADLLAWRAARQGRPLVVATPPVAKPVKKPRPVATYAGHADPVIDRFRRIDAAAELIAPILTDGVLLRLIDRVLRAGRLELCNELPGVSDTFTPAFRRRFAAELSLYIHEMSWAGATEACINCHSDRCQNEGGAK